MEQIIKQQPLCATLIEVRRTDLMQTDTEDSTVEIFVEVFKPKQKLLVVRNWSPTPQLTNTTQILMHLIEKTK